MSGVISHAMKQTTHFIMAQCLSRREEKSHKERVPTPEVALNVLLLTDVLAKQSGHNGMGSQNLFHRLINELHCDMEF